MSRDFWSRRREAVAAETEAELRAAERAVAEREEADLDALPDDEILARYDLPDPDTLETPEAVKDFLAHGLPQRLKTRALRRLWRLNPLLANIDGLVDYGEDYTDAATVIEGLQTAYQVGKGMMAHVEGKSQEAGPAADQPTEEEDGPESDIPLAEATGDDGPDPDQPPSPAVALADPVEDTPTPPSPNRRMTFQFESTT